MYFFTIIRRLSHPRVKKRLKIGLTVWAVTITLFLMCKLSYDIGYFKAQSVIDDKNAATPVVRQFLDIETAQKVVSGALIEDPNNPKTTVIQILNNDPKFSSIIIESGTQKNIAWIVDRRLLFIGDVLSDTGYNLTDAQKKQHNIH